MNDTKFYNPKLIDAVVIPPDNFVGHAISVISCVK